MPFGTNGTDRYIGINYDRMRKYRLARVRQIMEKYGYGTLISWDAWNMRYMTGGFPTVPCRWSASMISVLCPDGEPLLSATTSFDPDDLKKAMPWLREDRVTKDIGGGKLAFTKAGWQSFIDYMDKYIQANGGKGKPVALDLPPAPVPLKEVFEERGYEVVIPTQAMHELRMIKNEDEIACIRISAAIAEAAMADIAAGIHSCASENGLSSVGLRREYFMGSDEVLPVNIASGPRTNPMHSDFTDRMLVCGDLVDVSVDAATYCAYKTSLGRTFCVGKATQAQKDAYAVAYDLMQKAISAIKPGNTTADICAQWPSDPAFWGYDDIRACQHFAKGHGIGLIFQEAPYFSCAYNDATELKPGMVLALETWYGPRGADFGASLKETVLVTEKGCELITHYPSDKIIECMA